VTGAVLWSIGIFTVLGFGLTAMIVHMRRAPYFVHVYFSHPVVLVVALVCMIAGIAAVRRGLSPIDRLRIRLGDVHAGRSRAVEGDYPSEVQPLVDDLNSLLEHREQAVRRAVAKAGDLAHGLKTPLAVLAQEAGRADDSGQPELAESIRQQVDRMRRQIDYHLAHARAAASGTSAGARSSVAESADGLSRTLRRLYAERGIAIETLVADGISVRVQREDLDEMLGNLLDNACKWASTRVVLTATAGDGMVEVAVDDDGAGVEPGMWNTVLQRGVRADEAAPGTGLGLAIVRDLAELYGGGIALDRAPLGGLRARLRLPA
jgi:signal transduction histidine kinase